MAFLFWPLEGSKKGRDWRKAAMAGALGCAWGGASIYFGRRVDNPLIGEARQPLDGQRYGQAVHLLYGTFVAMAILTLVGLLAGRAGIWGLLSPV